MRPPRSRSSGAVAALVAAALTPAWALCAEPLSLRVDPPSLVLGAAKVASIVIEGAPEQPPAATASVGRIENLRPAGRGRYVAEWVPPADAHPQVAILAARSGERWGWAAIPLAGRGVAVARSAPGAAIRVTIGDVVFGPVRADGAGIATVPVVVPAGVSYAYHEGERLELNVPPTRHVHVDLASSAAPADVEQLVPFRVFAVTAAGTPRSGARVVAAVGRGEVGEIAEVGPGAYAGTWRLPPGPAERVTLSVGLADEPGLTSAVALDRPAGRAARVAVEAGQRRIVAGSVSPVALRVSVTDAAGNAVDAVPVLHATLGQVSAPVAAAPGAWEASLAIARAKGEREVVVTARAAGLEGRIAVEVVPEVADAPRERRVSVAPKAGIVAGPGGLLAPTVAAEGVFQTGLLDDRLALQAEAGIFLRDRTDAVTVGPQPLDVRGRVVYLPVIASVRFEGAVGARQRAWASLGAGAALVASEVSAGYPPTERAESALVPAARVAVGWGLRLGRVTPFGEMAIAWQGDPALEAFRGSVTVLAFLLGCRYDAF